MASTFNINAARGLMIGDGFRKSVVVVTGPASYVTGGEAVAAGQFRLGFLENVPLIPMRSNDGLSLLFGLMTINRTTGAATLQYYWPGAGASAAEEFAYTPADLKGATADVANSDTVDQAAAPVNSTLIASADTNTNFAGTVVVTGQPGIGRTVTITVLNDSGGALNMFEGTQTFTITGKFRGVAQTDTIAFTEDAGHKSIANGKFRFKQGVKPFDTITAITYDNTAGMDGGLKISAGVGSRIGLPRPRLTPADADVLTFAISGAAATVAGAFSDANGTVETGTTADAWDLQLVYKVAGTAANALQEVPNGTNLSTFSGSFVVYGR